jgi:hypothetical protein
LTTLLFDSAHKPDRQNIPIELCDLTEASIQDPSLSAAGKLPQQQPVELSSLSPFS